MARNKWLEFFEEYPTTKLTTEQLRQAEKSLAKAVNQRLVRLERSGVKKTTVRDTLRSNMEDINNFTAKGRVSTAEKSRRDTIKSINTMRNFLNAETSTVQGLKAYKKDVQQTFAANFDMDIESTSKMADLFKFAREKENSKYHVDSGTVAIIRDAQSKGGSKTAQNRRILKALRNYDYEIGTSNRIADRQARQFYLQIADYVTDINFED